MNAILDALAPLGVTDIPMPATPERIWRATRDPTAADTDLPIPAKVARRRRLLVYCNLAGTENGLVASTTNITSWSRSVVPAAEDLHRHTWTVSVHGLAGLGIVDALGVFWPRRPAST